MPCDVTLVVQGMRCLGAVTSADYMDTPPPPGPAPAPAQAAPDTRQAWECGSPDYMGTASFENILKKIDKTIQEKKINEGKWKNFCFMLEKEIILSCFMLVWNTTSLNTLRSVLLQLYSQSFKQLSDYFYCFLQVTQIRIVCSNINWLQKPSAQLKHASAKYLLQM